MIAEGVRFETDVTVGTDVSARYLRKTFDAILLAMGAGEPRPLRVPGGGVGRRPLRHGFPHPAEPPRSAGDADGQLGGPAIHASGKHVVVIGGGDTGSDCVGTSIRQGAVSVTQLEILPKPPEGRNPETPWPLVAADHADLQFPGRRLPAPLERADQGPDRPVRPRHRIGGLRSRLDPGRKRLGNEGAPGHRLHRQGRPRAPGDGLPARGALRAGQPDRPATRRPRQSRGRATT